MHLKGSKRLHFLLKIVHKDCLGLATTNIFNWAVGLGGSCLRWQNSPRDLYGTKIHPYTHTKTAITSPYIILSTQVGWKIKGKDTSQLVVGSLKKCGWSPSFTWRYKNESRMNLMNTFGPALFHFRFMRCLLDFEKITLNNVSSWVINTEYERIVIAITLCN